MTLDKFGKWVPDENASEPDYVPDPSEYPGYGWGWHGPWDGEYWDDLGYWPDERFKS